MGRCNGEQPSAMATHENDCVFERKATNESTHAYNDSNECLSDRNSKKKTYVSTILGNLSFRSLYLEKKRPIGSIQFPTRRRRFDEELALMLNILMKRNESITLWNEDESDEDTYSNTFTCHGQSEMEELTKVREILKVHCTVGLVAVRAVEKELRRTRTMGILSVWLAFGE